MDGERKLPLRQAASHDQVPMSHANTPHRRLIGTNDGVMPAHLDPRLLQASCSKGRVALRYFHREEMAG